MSRNDRYGAAGLVLCVIDALIIWAALSGHGVFALHVLETLVVWTIFACVAAYLLSVILRTGRELEREYEEDEDDEDDLDLHLSGDDDGSGLEPHRR